MQKSLIALAIAGSLLAACDSDGGRPAPVDRSPAVSNIADQAVVANGTSGPIAFTIDDEDPTSVVVEAYSDEESVVADAGLTLGGSGASRTIAVQPVVDTLGDSTISILVRDAGGQASETAFDVQIVPEVKSMQSFARDAFLSDENADPALINAVEFLQDADADDFTDLLAD
ncbi:MAG: hypothetical protein AAFX10_07655 [Pseudomonadota bacterium]